MFRNSPLNKPNAGFDVKMGDLCKRFSQRWGLNRNLVWSLGTAKAGRTLQELSNQFFPFLPNHTCLLNLIIIQRKLIDNVSYRVVNCKMSHNTLNVVMSCSLCPASGMAWSLFCYTLTTRSWQTKFRGEKGGNLSGQCTLTSPLDTLTYVSSSSLAHQNAWFPTVHLLGKQHFLGWSICFHYYRSQ